MTPKLHTASLINIQYPPTGRRHLCFFGSRICGTDESEPQVEWEELRGWLVWSKTSHWTLRFDLMTELRVDRQCGGLRTKAFVSMWLLRRWRLREATEEGRNTGAPGLSCLMEDQTSGMGPGVQSDRSGLGLGVQTGRRTDLVMVNTMQGGEMRGTGWQMARSSRPAPARSLSPASPAPEAPHHTWDDSRR